MQTGAPPKAGTLYVVATPIGHLGDLSVRALETLRTVDAICAEDTRHTRQLLSHFGLERPLLALHEHNEDAQAASLVRRLEEGDSLALVSDAGTPLVSDPGYRLVRAARAAGLLAIVGVVLLPVIRYSVVWWNSLHQGQTIRMFGESSMDASMVWPLAWMVIGTKLWFLGALLARARADNLRREAGKAWVTQVPEASR